MPPGPHDPKRLDQISLPAVATECDSWPLERVDAVLAELDKTNQSWIREDPHRVDGTVHPRTSAEPEQEEAKPWVDVTLNLASGQEFESLRGMLTPETATTPTSATLGERALRLTLEETIDASTCIVSSGGMRFALTAKPLDPENVNLDTVVFSMSPVVENSLDGRKEALGGATVADAKLELLSSSTT